MEKNALRSLIALAAVFVLGILSWPRVQPLLRRVAPRTARPPVRGGPDAMPVYGPGSRDPRMPVIDLPGRLARRLAGCYRFSAGRELLSPQSGGGFGTLPPVMVLTDSPLFAREGDPAYALRAWSDPDSARRWSPARLRASEWGPRADSLFAVFGNGDAGVALRFQVLGRPILFVGRSILSGTARPFTHLERRARWEPDVDVTAIRIPCPVG